MKKNEDLQINIHDTIGWETSLNARKNGFTKGIGKNLKKFLYIGSIVGVALFFNSCMGGYVATEPNYVEGVRPAQPSNLHVWIDGDWVYSRQNHGYTRNNGYWEKPNQGRTYISGRWQSTPKGHYWTKGHWQRNRRSVDSNPR